VNEDDAKPGLLRYVATVVFAIVVGIGAGSVFAVDTVARSDEFNWAAFLLGVIAGLTPIPFITAATLVVRAWVDIHLPTALEDDAG
jgi:hypothetical protein